MLGHCLVIGAVVAGAFRLPVLLVALSAVLIFMATQGLKQLARSYRLRERDIPVRIPWLSLGFLLLAAVLGSVALFGWRLYALFYWGAVALPLTVVYVGLLFQRRERSVLGEWLGIFGLTLSAGAVWSAGTGEWGRGGLILWLLAFLYFGGSVPYVRLRVKQMKEAAALSRSRQSRDAFIYASLTLFIVALAAAIHLIPALAVVPFALSLAKVAWAAIGVAIPRKIAHIGYSEAVLSTVFAVFTITAFWPAS